MCGTQSQVILLNKNQLWSPTRDPNSKDFKNTFSRLINRSKTQMTCAEVQQCLNYWKPK